MRVPTAKRYGSILVRPATQGDFDAINESVPHRMTAIVGEDDDGRILGIGGIMWMPDGRAYLFTKLCEDKKHEHAVVLHIAATKFLNEVRRAGIRYVTALPDPAIKDTASRWMAALGMKPTGVGDTWEL